MKALLLVTSLAVTVTSLPRPALADPGARCTTRIIADVGAEEAPEQIKSKSNGTFGPVTEIKVDRRTGRMTYCAKNSYCYWSNAFEFVSPCRIKRDDSRSDSRHFSYFTR